MVLLFLAALMALSDFGHAQKDSVVQFAQETAIQVGQNATLHCNFSTSTSAPYIFWYQQRLTQSPQFLLQVNKFKPHVHSGRISSVLSMENSQVLLHVQDAKLQDSAVYLCALLSSGFSNKLTFGSGTRLSVLPKVVPSPSVYRLTTKDDEDLEMCLITDYAPNNLQVKSNSADRKTEAVVEVATSENKQEASYLTTYWAKKDKMECGAEDENARKLEGKDPESGASTVCVTGMSPHFKTDENLNMLSLTQLGLKIILIKGVIFNVVMTILMWKKKE